MGFEKERFETQPPNELTCVICKDVFQDPVQGACGHVYCSECRVQSDPWNYEDICPVEYKYKTFLPGLGRGHGRSLHSSNITVGHVSVRDGLGGLMLDDPPLPGYGQLQMAATFPSKFSTIHHGQPESLIGWPCPRGTVQLAEPLRLLLNKQRIKCKYFDTCSWSGPIADMAFHESVCAEQVIGREIEEKYQEIRNLKKKLFKLTNTSDNQ